MSCEKFCAHGHIYCILYFDLHYLELILQREMYKNLVCTVCIVLGVARLVEWLSQQSGRRETGVSQDEHVAGEVAAVVAKLEQKETELHEVSER